jgi:hypothetical protein
MFCTTKCVRLLVSLNSNVRERTVLPLLSMLSIIFHVFFLIILELQW